jgi:geranylgeranylglycerol-phosphate geranylgeranyltransferase
MKKYLELTRINHGVITAVAIVAGQILTLRALPSTEIVLLSALCGILIQAASFTIGDYWDLETDKKNRRYDRPLARGDVQPMTAMLLSVILFFAGLYAGFLIGEKALEIALVFTAVGVAYAYWLKKVALWGNVATAASMAIPFVFGAYTVSTAVPQSVWIITIVAFFAGMGRELIKGIQDYDGDKATGRSTFAIAAGKNAAASFGKSFIALAVMASVLPFFFINGYMNDYVFLALILLNDAMWLGAVNKMKDLAAVRQTTLYGMMLGTAAFLIGAVF